MSMWCGHPGCFQRLWPGERSGKTYKGEERPVVTRDADGKIVSVRCERHAEEKR